MPRPATVLTGVILILVSLLPAPVLGQVTFERLLNRGTSRTIG